jgi:hypothetical protein
MNGNLYFNKLQLVYLDIQEYYGDMLKIEKIVS